MGSDKIEDLLANARIGTIDEDGMFHDLGLFKDFKLVEIKDTAHVFNELAIKKVIFNNPATIVFWEDGTKTVVKCKYGDLFSYDMGIYAATLKKIFGDSYSIYKKDVNRIIEEEIKDQEKILAKLAKILGKEKDI